MSEYKVGFKRIDVTPPLGLEIPGYFHQRLADGVLSPVTGTALSFSDGEKTAVLFSLDMVSVEGNMGRALVERVAEQNGLPPEAVLISCTHSHTGPTRDNKAYNEFLGQRLADAAALAIREAAPVTKMYAGERECEKVTFSRRFLKKDGTYKTFGKVKDPEVAAPASKPDEALRLLRVERENAPEVLLVNFQMHPDCVGGTKYSADYPHYVRSYVERAFPGSLCVYFNGFNGDLAAQGWNPFLEEWERGRKVVGEEGYAETLGQSIAGAVMQLHGRMKPIEPGPVAFERRFVPSRTKMDPARLPAAKRIGQMFEEGREDEILAEFKGIFGPTLQTIKFEAHTLRLLERRNGPEICELAVSAVRFGPVAFAGFPGEAFCALGDVVREDSPYEMVFTLGITNDRDGYFPTREAFEQGGYEPGISRYVPGTGEGLAQSLQQMLKRMSNE